MLEFLFNPLLVFEPVIAITIFAIIVLILINLGYRFLVNQQEAKQIKERSKELNKLLKEEQKKGNTARVNELMKETMAESNKMMKMSMKPMMLSFIVVILFLPWLSANYGDMTAAFNENTGNVTIGNDFYLVQKDGDKINVIKDSATIASFSSSADEEERRYEISSKHYLLSYQKENCMLFSCSPEGVKFARIVAFLPVTLPLFGSDVGWLGWYLLISIPFVILLRKILKIST